MDDELEPEVLSYREFTNRETLRAWQQRRRAIESPPGKMDGLTEARSGSSQGASRFRRRSLLAALGGTSAR